MQRASRIFGKIGMPEETLSAQQLVCSTWAAAVGKKVAQRTRAVKLVRTRLTIDVEDQTLQKSLMALSRQILANLEKLVGPGLVDDLHFRVIPRRMEPRRATASQPLLDEADQIADPGLRRIYRNARAKEIA